MGGQDGTKVYMEQGGDKQVVASGGEIEILTGGLLDNQGAVKNSAVVVLTTTRAILASESGTRFILNSATAFATTLPAVAAGLEYWVMIGATEPTTSHTLLTEGADNVMEGCVVSMEDAAGSSVFAADSDTITFVASKALHGDYVHLWCDGTNWYVDGMCTVQDGIAGSQAA